MAEAVAVPPPLGTKVGYSAEGKRVGLKCSMCVPDICSAPSKPAYIRNKKQSARCHPTVLGHPTPRKVGGYSECPRVWYGRPKDMPKGVEGDIMASSWRGSLAEGPKVRIA
jgi:hypothetical protein